MSMRQAWEIPWGEIELVQEIGRGVVHAACGGTTSTWLRAVKSVVGQFMGGRPGPGGRNGHTELDTEIALQKDDAPDPSIVLFFGAGISPDGASFPAVELVKLVTLTGFLQRETFDRTTKRSFVTAALDTVRGMAHVHAAWAACTATSRAVTRLLISASLQVKVADFGRATIAVFASELSGGAGSGAGEAGRNAHQRCGHAAVPDGS